MMAVITVRNLPEQTKQHLRVKAAQAGISLEQLVRELLNKEANNSSRSSYMLGDIAAQYFADCALDSDELVDIHRASKRKTPGLDE